MKSNPEVSIVIPAYNSAEHLMEAVESVQAQSYKDYELLIVDDCSSDGTSKIARSLTGARIKYIRHEENRGAAAARNTGISLAAGRFIAFLDSDDIWLPEKIAKQLTAMEKANSSVGALCTDFAVRRNKRGALTKRRPRAPKGWPREFLDSCGVSPGSTMIVRREVFEKIGVLDANLKRFEDWDWLLRYVEKFKFAVYPEVLSVVTVQARKETTAPRVIAEAARRLLKLHERRLSMCGGSGALRRFRSSLLLEEAAAYFWIGDHKSALFKILEAATLSPSRVIRMGRRVGVKLWMRDY